ncbi:unnamed protein product, partial [Polarella glacialis]
ELGLRRDFVLVQLLRGNDYLPPLACSFSCEDLWPCYLRWRRTRSPDLGLVAQASGCRDEGSVQERLQILPAQISDFMSRLSTGFPSGPTAQPIAAEELAKGVEAYVHGLIWCLETYVNGFCPDFHFRFPRAWTPCASAELLLRHNKALADGLAPASDGSCTAPAASPAACLASGSGGGLGRRGGVAPPPPLPPLSPLACAAAVLPVSELRALLLPTAPCLAALLEPEKGLLWEVARLEACTECGQLEACVAAVPPGGKKFLKRRRALDAHRRAHRDIEDVQLDALEREVQRLCAAAAAAEGAGGAEVAVAVEGVAAAAPPSSGPSLRELLTLVAAPTQFLCPRSPQLEAELEKRRPVVEVCDGSEAEELACPVEASAAPKKRALAEAQVPAASTESGHASHSNNKRARRKERQRQRQQQEQN